jgi:GT2 family glycosyltransferase
MNKKEKIGVGICTFNRLEYLKGLINSLIPCQNVIDELVVVNDNGEVPEWDLPFGTWINNEKNSGVAVSKNNALKYLLEKDCDYFFLIEDDVLIKNSIVFQKYIEAYKKTNIQHFNYGPGTPFNRKQNAQFDIHNRSELDQQSEPLPRITIDYGKGIKIDLYTHVAGMFSFFTKNVLEKVGLIDEQFYNAWDHVDHTYRIIKAGYHPPFWWFADIYNSNNFIEEQKEAIQKSAISKNSEQWIENVHKGRELYLNKHGHYPNQPPIYNQEQTLQILKQIKNG